MAQLTPASGEDCPKPSGRQLGEGSERRDEVLVGPEIGQPRSIHAEGLSCVQDLARQVRTYSDNGGSSCEGGRGTVE